MIAALLADNPGHYHVIGPGSSGKTTIALRWAAAARRPVLFMDCDATLNLDWAEKQGLSLDKDDFELLNPYKFNEALSFLRVYAQAGVRTIVVESPQWLDGWVEREYLQEIRQLAAQYGARVLTTTRIPERKWRPLILGWALEVDVEVCLEHPVREKGLQIGTELYHSATWSPYRVNADRFSSSCNNTEGRGRIYLVGGS